MSSSGGEFGADVVSVGVVELFEQGEGSSPGVACGVRVAGGVVGVAEARRCRGFGVSVAEVVVQVEGSLVAGDRLGVVAE